ncbi:MAG: circularly permuted type 2 ATP-grasp protein [Myxococcales bacterium]|nr:circularly permuted type 2 ATP-grasp protein [Myxococcales bacterium]
MPSDTPSKLLDDYQPWPDVPDELLGSERRVRSGWQELLEHLAPLGRDELLEHFARGDQYLADAGVYFRQYGQDSSHEREWPLSHLPVIIHEREWTEIAAGLTQRAELLEAIVADMYGDNTLARDGHLPPALLAESPEWLRPMVGIRPRSGHFLHFLAFEIGRGPGGRWWVLGDRTQAPSGAGFALENRVATSRVFADLYSSANVHRLAGFFQAFRDALQGLRAEEDSQVAILTPGPHNDTYYEHAYIARYLGFALLEGEDLVVVDGRVMVRTVTGLQPVSVLFRRLDATFADPLELDERSGLGTAGMVDAVRRGGVTMVNALGAGVLETRALMAFLPRLCEALRGEPLRLPNIATWWCGQESERAHVLRNLDRVMISPALSTGLPFDTSGAIFVGGRAPGAARVTRAEVEARLMSDGPHWVAQESVTLSTTPAFVDGVLKPRPMSVRVFLARTPDGWQVMPGGFARIGRSEDPGAIAMQRGGSVADVWIWSDSEVDAPSLLPHPSQPFLRTLPGALTSRAADNLFWLGRYVERVEVILRLLRAYHVRLAEAHDENAALCVRLRGHLATFGVDPSQPIPKGLLSALSAVVHSASQVRDLFSVDGWVALQDLAQHAQRYDKKRMSADDTARVVGVLLRKVSGFSGLVHENMYRFTSWRFLSMGRALERAMLTVQVLLQLTDTPEANGALDLAVELCDSVMTHRRRYVVATTRETVIDLLALDALNPRSVRFQLDAFREHASALPGFDELGQLSAFARATLQVHTQLTVKTVDTLGNDALQGLLVDLAGLSEHLTNAYLR